MKKTKCVLLIAITMVLLLTGCKVKEENIPVHPQTGEESLEGDEITSTIDEKTESEQIDVSINDEITAIEEAALEIQNRLQEAMTQTDMNIISDQQYQLWDDELNSLWSRFSDAASEDLKAAVLEEQRNWIKDKEEKVEYAVSGSEGGSIEPLLRNTTAASITRIRCYELANYLAQATGQTFDLEIPEPEKLTFVDREGTSDTVYSQLIMTPVAGNNYTATIEIYRLATFEGTAIMQNDDVYEFIDETFGVKGIIRLLDRGLTATFEITDSDGSIVEVGDLFEFSKDC